MELICSISGNLFAIEHTGIEPFSGQIKLEVNAKKLFGPIQRTLEVLVPEPEGYVLCIPVGAISNLRIRHIPSVQNALVSWIREVGPSLRMSPPGRLESSQQHITVPGVPFTVSLYRYAKRPRRLSITHTLPPDDDLQEARNARILEACNRKFPKLAEWKRTSGARTVLVLEENDIQLTNEIDVAKAVLAAAEIMENKPDEIYLVSTAPETGTWWVSCISIDNKTFFDFAEFDERTWEINPATLIALTSR